MKLIVGLGNPGPKYARNRHNVGFLALDALADAYGLPAWRSKFQGLVTEGRIGPDRVVLLKPETFMNLSGDSVQAAARFHKLEPGEVIVLHDELDLAPGRVRVKTGGGHAGHNGLRSIAAHLGPDFVRVRIGVGHPGDKRVVSNYVLSDFAKIDADWLEALLPAMAKAAPDLVAKDFARFLNALPQPAEPEPARPKAEAKPKPAAEEAPTRAAGTAEPTQSGPVEQTDPRSTLQRLVDRFR